MASADTAVLSGNSVIAKYSGAAWVHDAINQKVRAALILILYMFLGKIKFTIYSVATRAVPLHDQAVE